jgi:hypothetical protein
MHTRLAECSACHVLVHQPTEEPYPCPSCGGPLAPGLRSVGFGDARRVFGEPGAPWRAPPAKGAGSRYPCVDGHRVRSREESVVDDWLASRSILHEAEPKLKGMRPDWRVGNVYVEYWGLAGQRGYEERRRGKLEIYRRRRLRLVELFPDDLDHLERKLGFLADDAGARRGRLF